METPITTPTVETLASDALLHMDRHADGRWFVSCKAPEWISDMCRDAHGDFLPDDHRYAFIVEALRDLENGCGEDFSPEADIFTHELLKWVASNLNRVGYVDEAIENYGPFKTLVDSLQAAQYEERREVYQSVYASLAARVEALEGLEG